MKLRYRITGYGWYVPQFLLEDNTWQDFLVWNLGEEIKEIVIALADRDSKWEPLWHMTPDRNDKTQKVDDMPLIFKTELKVCAFLGAAKINYSERTKEFDL
jgi:hypothetical protein